MAVGKKKNYITVLTVLSAFAVVMLHANGAFWTYKKGTDWAIENIIECIFYFAVPVFCMASGAKLLDFSKRYKTSEFFKKRIGKVLIPFVVWSLVGALYFCHNDMTFWSLLSGIFNSKFVPIYWFFIMIFSLYLAMPIFSAIPERKRKSVFGYAIIIGLIINIALPFVFALMHATWNGELFLWPVGGYIIYALMGYYIDRYEIPKKWRMVIYTLGVAGLMTHIIGTFVLSNNAGEIVRTFKGYQNLPCVLYSAAIFLAFKNLDKKFTRMKLFDAIAPATFGVYLIHWFVLDIFKYYANINMDNVFVIFGVGIGLFVWCVLATKLLKNIPIVRQIVP
ncbi:MAG: acyltransferase family protein [Candidatus Saccharibacteria bacterium]|nr:acyltransferase family protein [Candidatus Saccharibacteria bacterium]